MKSSSIIFNGGFFVMLTLPESYNDDTWAGSVFRNKEVTVPEAVYDNGRVIVVDGYLHSIDGYPIYFDGAVCSMSDKEERDHMIDMVRELYVDGPIHESYGNVVGFLPVIDLQEQKLVLLYSSVHYRCLPDTDKSNIQRFCSEYEGWQRRELEWEKRNREFKNKALKADLDSESKSVF